MTVQYPETGARPLPYGAAPRETASETYEPATYDSLDGEETFHNTPVYARRPTKKGGVPKMALMAIPVVLALGVGAWALTAGESSREQAPAEDTDSLTTSRLSDVPAPASPEVAAPAVTEAAPAAPVAAAPAIAPAARPAAPAARAATPPARASQAP
ncbi:MAG: hypothetical protein K1X35_12370, partial [Caulobacteraceae bacterium]|nr:hypothetical protein [Caulobacteraceae bacterium]